jgi:hypothetical protein
MRRIPRRLRCIARRALKNGIGAMCSCALQPERDAARAKLRAFLGIFLSSARARFWHEEAKTIFPRRGGAHKKNFFDASDGDKVITIPQIARDFITASTRFPVAAQTPL